MANPQPTDSHLRIAHTILEAIMLRAFSKRQINVLLFVLRLSWGCNKKYAIIPRKGDFGLIGVGKTHITTELDWLVASKVIYIENNCYTFNKDFDEWQVSRVNPYSPDKVTELVTINIKNGHQQVTDLVTTEPLEVTETVTDEPTEVTEKVTSELPKRELNGYQKGNKSTPELGTGIERDRKSIENTTSTGVIFETYENLIGRMEPNDINRLNVWIDDLGENAVEWILKAIKETAKTAKAEKKNYYYMNKILLRYQGQGNTDDNRNPVKKEQSTHGDKWA